MVRRLHSLVARGLRRPDCHGRAVTLRGAASRNCAGPSHCELAAPTVPVQPPPSMNRRVLGKASSRLTSSLRRRPGNKRKRIGVHALLFFFGARVRPHRASRAVRAALQGRSSWTAGRIGSQAFAAAEPEEASESSRRYACRWIVCDLVTTRSFASTASIGTAAEARTPAAGGLPTPCDDARPLGRLRNVARTAQFESMREPCCAVPSQATSCRLQMLSQLQPVNRRCVGTPCQSSCSSVVTFESADECAIPFASQCRILIVSFAWPTTRALASVLLFLATVSG